MKIERKDMIGVSRHREIMRLFKEISHTPDEDIEAWYPNGRDSVRVKLKNKRELIFTYKSYNYWRLETRGAFTNGLD